MAHWYWYTKQSYTVPLAGLNSLFSEEAFQGAIPVICHSNSAKKNNIPPNQPANIYWDITVVLKIR